MILDASAVLAVLLKEEGSKVYLDQLDKSRGTCSMSASSWLECCIKVDSYKDPILSRRLDEFIAKAEIDIVEFTPGQAAIARQAYRDFGKGSGHPAQLNFGDCFAYALAKETGEALLFKGADFSQTDVKRAL